ncbi:MAG: valine--tRNA ligase [Euryarchaeota archaeon]|nr:valine--tRNA ligase [Euryarchaeota archaeon]
MAEPRLKEKQWDLAFEFEVLERWDREKPHRFEAGGGKTVYVIDTPPPYPSGDWHPGAVIGYTMIDMVARAQRMLGRAVLFPFGLDRNGINIERTVEKKYRKPLHEWDREEFIATCRAEIERIGQGILEIVRRMGMSMDRSDVYYTDRDDYRAYSQAIFLDLFQKGYFYRGERPSFYCVYCRTTLAEADIVYEETPSKLVKIRFPLKEGGSITIATTRPELLPACRTVIVHPDDERWRGAVGKKAVVPIFGQLALVRAHPDAKMEFGSGAAMICSYGDMVDVRLFRELQLEPVKAIDEDGHVTQAAGVYAGLTVEEARERILADLRSQGFVEKVESIQHMTPLCERSRTPVEFIPSEAWYLKQLEFRENLRTLAEDMTFHPARHRQILLNWMNSLTIDWPISRRRYYHTEIPLWYCVSCGEILVPEPGPYYRPWKDPAPFETCPKCGGTEFRGEDRVFDTWMDSSNSNLWVTRYLRDGAFFERNFPCSLRPQGRDIVRTWLYYTTLKSWLVLRKKPFEHVFIHGMGLDARGRAMHRTLGNYLPVEPLVEKYGADAIRFFAAAETGPGDDFRITEEKVGGSRKFLSKLWNVARFISSFEEPREGKLLPTDEWILAELNDLIAVCRGAHEDMNFFVAANRVRDFIWNVFAPHYVEMAKARAYEGDTGARWTLHTVLRDVLKLLAPITPFVTHKIWGEMYGGSVHAEMLPQPRDVNEALRDLTAKLVAFNSLVWKEKKDRGLSLKDALLGMAVPEELRPFAADLARMHRLA